MLEAEAKERQRSGGQGHGRGMPKISASGDVELSKNRLSSSDDKLFKAGRSTHIAAQSLGVSPASAAPAALPCRARVVRTSVVISEVALNPRHEPGSRVAGAVGLVIPLTSLQASVDVDQLALRQVHTPG